MSGERVELGSSEWIQLAIDYLRQHLPGLGARAHGVDWALCENFTDPPAHLDDGTGSVAWWFRIVGTTLTAGIGDNKDVDVYIKADYAEVLPRARTINDAPTPEMRAQAEQLRRQAIEAGLEPPPHIPAPLFDLIRGLHNFLAPRTA